MGLVHELIAARTALWSNAPAVVQGDRVLSYGELNRQADHLADRLRRMGVRPEVPVCVALPRTPELIVALLGVMKAGGAYVPLDPAYPAERLALMLADSGAGVIVTAEPVLTRLPAHGCAVVCLDCEAASLATEADEVAGEPQAGVGATNLVYLMYTSGSTGRPKGTEVLHGGLANFAHWFQSYYGLTPADRVAYVAGVGFDAGVGEIWPALAAGAALCLPDDAVRLEPERLRDWLVQERITVSFAPTPMAELLLGLPWPADTALRVLYSGGDKLRRYPPPGLPFSFFDMYGPTEATCAVSYSPLTAVPEPDAPTPPIGRPIGNVQVYLLDGALRPVAPGEPGEICVGGAGVTRGYRERPDLTAERFVPDPFSGTPGARLYRTGDLGRLRPDGSLAFLGRVDNQVKIRGFRIEPGEIEAVLKQHPGVRDAAVAAREDGPAGEKQLVAYVAAAAAPAPTVAELRLHLRSRLPAYMVPAAYCFLSALPLTDHGKIDRQRLPAPDWSQPGADDGYTAPRTPLEEDLAAIWSAILGVGRVGAFDNFFDLGGHSLRAAQVLARVRERLGADLFVLDLFEHPTVAALADVIEQRRASGSAAMVIEPADRSRPVPLSLAQEPIWFLQELFPGMMSYNAQATLRFRGDLQVDVLERALSEIVRRHEIFRTTFPAVDGRPVQVIHPPFAITLPVTDLSGEPITEVDRRVSEICRAPFDVTQLPLMRWVLFRLGPAEHLLVHVEHHFVHDGWSFTVFLRELRDLYKAYCAGQPSPLPDLPIQFADFACAQRRWLESAEAAEQLSYWTEQLAGMPPVLDLPTDRPRPARQRFQGDARRIQLPADLCRAVRAFSRQRGLSLYMTMLAAFQTLMNRYSGQRDFCTGAGVANRRWQSTEQLLGMIVNMVVLRADFRQNPTGLTLLEQVRRTALQAFAHQDLPLEQVVQALQPERSLSHQPLCQVAFSFHDSPMPALDLPGLSVAVFEGVHNGSAKFDLNVIAIPRAEQQTGTGGETTDEITVIWEWDTDLFDAATIDRMVGHYCTLLRGLIAHPELPVADLPLLTEPELRQLQAWNAAAPSMAVGPLVHQLVAEQAARTPQALAVADEERSLTYGALNALADGWAAALRAHGVGLETPVVVCLPRSCHLVLAELAVLKAGGTYLPIDPKSPREHLAYIVADSKAPVVLTVSDLRDRLPDGAAQVVCLDDPAALPQGAGEGVVEGEGVADGGSPGPSPAPSAENLAYIIYTSGSTGRPKGTLIHHQGFANLTEWYRRTLGLDTDARVAQVASSGFDATVFEIWPVLMAGGSLHMVPDYVRAQPEAFRDWLLAKSITHTFVPTPLCEAVLGLTWPPNAPLRTVVTGGDRLRLRPGPQVGFQLLNAYGPTECTVAATCGTVAPAGDGLPDIGGVLPGLQAYVLDAALRPVPVGIPGELYIGGVGVARGYLGQPGLTAERFLPDPYPGRPGARLYRTGDLVRRRPDGRFEFLGRADYQVKIRGHRIELGEIEAGLQAHPAVAEACVTALEDRHGEKRLVAYCTPAPGATISPGELRAHLAARLPSAMLPTCFVALDAMPHTASGKVDRQALPAPDWQQQPEERYEAPGSPVETAVAAIWSEVLGLARIGVHDDFFALGGHSLKVGQVLSRMRESLGVDLPLRTLFEAPTVRLLAEAVVTQQMAQTDQLDLDQLLEELASLSEAEISRRLGGN